MNCKYCHTEIADGSPLCPECGAVLESQNEQGKPIAQEKANGGLIVLSVLFPIVGIILFDVNHAEHKKVAKTYLLSAVISVAACAVVSVISVVGLGIAYRNTMNEIGGTVKNNVERYYTDSEMQQFDSIWTDFAAG